MFLYGGLRVIDGTLTLGTFVAFMAYQMRFLPPMQALMGLYANLATARVSLRRVSEILDVPVEVEEPAAPVRCRRSRGGSAFEDVTLSFDRGAPVLERLSFAVRAGRGAGDRRRQRQRQVDDRRPAGAPGRSRQRRRPARRPRPADAPPDGPAAARRARRSAAGILHASIAENIRYARPEATDAEVRTAAHRRRSTASSTALPQRLDTIVGERGAALSVGERQRLAMARAFLTDPAVLVLDEPTAALDPRAERRIVEGYESVMRGRTTIVITHRLELARSADRIVVLDGARIVDAAPAGTVQELFAVGELGRRR